MALYATLLDRGFSEELVSSIREIVTAHLADRTGTSTAADVRRRVYALAGNDARALAATMRDVQVAVLAHEARSRRAHRRRPLAPLNRR